MSQVKHTILGFGLQNETISLKLIAQFKMPIINSKSEYFVDRVTAKSP